MRVWASLRSRPRLRQVFAAILIVSCWGCRLVISSWYDRRRWWVISLTEASPTMLPVVLFAANVEATMDFVGMPMGSEDASQGEFPSCWPCAEVDRIITVMHILESQRPAFQRAVALAIDQDQGFWIKEKLRATLLTPETPTHLPPRILLHPDWVEPDPQILHLFLLLPVASLVYV